MTHLGRSRKLLLPGYPNEISEKWTAVRQFCQVAGINTQRAACAGAYAAAWPPATASAWLRKRRIAAKSAGSACDASSDAKTSGEGRVVVVAGGVAVSSALSALAAPRASRRQLLHQPVKTARHCRITAPRDASAQRSQR